MFFDINSEKGDRDSIIIHASILLLICLACFVVFWQTGLLSSGFRLFINDHLMIKMHHDVVEQGLFAAIKQWVVIDHKISRFQPFYYIQAVTLSKLFGPNAFLWFSYASLLTGLMGCCLFLFARLLDMPILVALFFSGAVLIGPQAATWAQPSHPQVVGMFLLTASLLFAGVSAKPNRYQTVSEITFIVLVFLASLSKESFIIFIPALLSIKVWLHSRFHRVSFYQAIAQNKLVIALLLSLTAIQILYILFVIGTTGMGYAGVDQNTFKFSRLGATLITLIQRSHLEIFVASIIIALILTAWKQQPLADFKILYPVGLIVLLIVFPQILLYAKSGIGGIYLVPAIIGSALLNAQALTLLKERSKWWGNAMVGVAIVILLAGMPYVWNTYSQMATDSRRINTFLQQVETCTPNNEPILIALNPRVRYEIAFATKNTLDIAFQRNQLILATYGLEKTDFFSNSLRKLENKWSFLDPQQVVAAYDGRTITTYNGDKNEIAAIAIFDNLNRDFLQTSSDWFVRENYRVMKFPNSMVPIRLYCKKQPLEAS
jgi:hypothetical protein